MATVTWLLAWIMYQVPLCPKSTVVTDFTMQPSSKRRASTPPSFYTWWNIWFNNLIKWDNIELLKYLRIFGRYIYLTCNPMCQNWRVQQSSNFNASRTTWQNLCRVTNPCYIMALPHHGNCVILQIHCGDAHMGTAVWDPSQNRYRNCRLSLTKYLTQVLQIEKRGYHCFKIHTESRLISPWEL